MEESKNFHSIKIIKIQNENDFKNKTDKFKINQKFNANIKNIIIIILILIIIILCLIIGILLLFKVTSNINRNDNNKYLSNKKLFQIKSDIIKEGKNQIHIAMALDNNFIYPTLVSMTSALYNNNHKENII